MLTIQAYKLEKNVFLYTSTSLLPVERDSDVMLSLNLVKMCEQRFIISAILVIRLTFYTCGDVIWFVLLFCGKHRVDFNLCSQEYNATLLVNINTIQNTNRILIFIFCNPFRCTWYNAILMLDHMYYEIDHTFTTFYVAFVAQESAQCCSHIIK